LEGLESESLAVKQKFLNLLTSMCAIKGVVLVREAEEVKSRIQGEKEEARKLALIKEEDQKLRKGVDEMLK
jgi:hypothetical protein